VAEEEDKTPEQSGKMVEKETITKFDAAERQLKTAIKLFFNKGGYIVPN